MFRECDTVRLMKIVFDMDNTLTDECGSSVRPGIIGLLTRLKTDGHILCLWTNSTRDRALSILRDHKLEGFFSTTVFREDYDPKNTGLKKDIRTINGDVLVDDDTAEIEFVRSIDRRGVIVASFRKRGRPNPIEMSRVYRDITNRRGIFRRLFGRS